MNALRSVVAALALAGTIYPQASDAALVFRNGTDVVEWSVGEPAPSINLGPDWFVAEACGAELLWVYEKFTAIPMRTLSGAAAARRAGTAVKPNENECVIWRGDDARFIVDNMVTVGK